MSKNSSANSKSTSWLRELLIIVISAVVLALLLKSFIVDSRMIPSTSMVPTLEVGDRVVLNKLAYLGNKEPERGDIIVFEPPAELNETYDLIKRVIGLPGETVYISGGVVYIDGEALEEDYLAEEPDYEYGPVLVPDDCYFMLGDNRNLSRDSHMWNDPFIHVDTIKGRSSLRYWPISRIGAFN